MGRMSKTANQDLNAGRIMMDGTSTRKTYLVFARRGDIMAGIQHGTYIIEQKKAKIIMIQARLRVARGASTLFGKEDKAGAVVTLADQNLKPVDAFNFEFDKKGDEYCSTYVMSTEDFTMGEDHGNLITMLKEGAFPERIAAYVAARCPPQSLILTEREIAEWLRSHYSRGAEQIEQAHEKMLAERALLTDLTGSVTTGIEFRRALSKALAEEDPAGNKAEDLDDDQTEEVIGDDDDGDITS